MTAPTLKIKRLEERVKELEAALRPLIKACDENLQDECSCHPAYKERGLRDPNCEFCDIGVFVLPLVEQGKLVLLAAERPEVK